MKAELHRELATLINKHKSELVSKTPAPVVAMYLLHCLTAFEIAVDSRDSHFNINIAKDGELPF